MQDAPDVSGQGGDGRILQSMTQADLDTETHGIMPTVPHVRTSGVRIKLSETTVVARPLPPSSCAHHVLCQSRTSRTTHVADSGNHHTLQQHATAVPDSTEQAAEHATSVPGSALADKPKSARISQIQPGLSWIQPS
eukprot:3604475-Rhodomonas_salina.1